MATINKCFICGEHTAPMHTRTGRVVQVDFYDARAVRFNPKKDKVHICKTKKHFTS